MPFTGPDAALNVRAPVSACSGAWGPVSLPKSLSCTGYGSLGPSVRGGRRPEPRARRRVRGPEPFPASPAPSPASRPPPSPFSADRPRLAAPPS